MSWDWLKQGGPVSNFVGGGLDFFTGGATDFDGRGRGNWNIFDPIGGGSDKKWGPESSDGFSFGDAMDAFTKGYAATMGGGGATPGGSSFLNAYTSGKGATPTTSSPVSTSSAFTAGGKTHTMPGIIIDEPVDFYAFRDNVQYPTQGGSGSAPKKDKFGDFLNKAGQVISIAKFLCDIRTKTDISPLETTEVNDDLAQAAFFVKELRECS